MAAPFLIKPDPSQEALLKEICSKLVSLLESKHLFQSVHVDFREVFPDSFPADERERLIGSVMKKAWSFEPEDQDHLGADPLIGNSGDVVSLTIPTIKVPCNQCKDDHNARPPHNSGFKGLQKRIGELTLSPRGAEGQIVQIFFLPFQCQSCRGEPLIFVVRRCGTKLQIVGRSQFEKVQVPKFIPKDEQKYYSDAVVAFQTGRILAALFYLRTLVEQYLRRILKTDEKTPGEDLCERYGGLLSDEFPRESIPSFKSIYQELSAKLHSAEKDEEQYKKSVDDIERHFDCLRLFPLKDSQPGEK